MEKSGPKLVWRSLGSIIGTIVLLTVIILACILGSLIPQNAHEQFYLSRYGLKLYRLLQLTDIIDLYHSWWFLTLLSLLGLNLLIHTLTSFSLKLGSVGRALAHLGIIIILVSVLISTIRRETGFMEIYEGEETGSFFLEDKDKPLPFKVYLEDFIIEYYSDDPSSAIKDYKSKLKVIDRGQIAAVKTVEVNDPLRYGGYTFYQHGYDDNNSRYTVLQVVKDPGVPSVYAGFILLMVGLIFVSVVNPLITKDKS
ncbi:MAG: cytochrome c biogenesis protein ResB [Candidatus Latescibacteria bacterium]|nr:cytochrome c biogenesis protein ResB [Candidatus Latescibacterota bacterium]